MKKQGEVNPPDFSGAIQGKISALKLQYYFFWLIFMCTVSGFIITSDIGIELASLSIFVIFCLSYNLVGRYFKESDADLRIYYKNYFEDYWKVGIIEIQIQQYSDYLDKVKSSRGKI